MTCKLTKVTNPLNRIVVVCIHPPCRRCSVTSSCVCRTCSSSFHSVAWCWCSQSVTSSVKWRWQVPSLLCVHCSVGSLASSSVSFAAGAFVSQAVSDPAAPYSCVSSFSLSSRRWWTPLSHAWGMVPLSQSVVRPLHFFICLLSLCLDVNTASRHFPHP